MVKFATLSPSEQRAVNTIITRYNAIVPNAPESLDTEMDICAVHHHTPMDLRGLSEADDFTLVHDISGIAAHINRNTGKLERCFLPRSARPNFGE